MTDAQSKKWLAEAAGALHGDFGLPPSLARAVAAKLLEREQAGAGVRDALFVVQDHMDSDEPPIVDPDTFEYDEPHAHTENFN